MGDGPDHCFVEAADGWLGVGATTDEQRAAWDGIRGVDGAALAELTVDAVVDACRAAGVPAIAVLSRDDVYTSTMLAEHDCFLTVDDDDLGEVRVIRGYSEWDGVPAAHAGGDACRRSRHRCGTRHDQRQSRNRNGEPVIDFDRLAAWMDDQGLPGRVSPSSTSSCPAARRTRSTSCAAPGSTA